MPQLVRPADEKRPLRNRHAADVLPVSENVFHGTFNLGMLKKLGTKQRDLFLPVQLSMRKPRGNSENSALIVNVHVCCTPFTVSVTLAAASAKHWSVSPAFSTTPASSGAT